MAIVYSYGLRAGWRFVGEKEQKVEKKLLSYLSSSGETIIIEFKKREAGSHILIEIT